jgi:hypothetical protein
MLVNWRIRPLPIKGSDNLSIGLDMLNQVLNSVFEKLLITGRNYNRKFSHISVDTSKKGVYSVCMQRFNLFITEKQRKALESLAHNNASVSEQIRTAIDEYLKKRKVGKVTNSPSKKL